MTDYVLGKASCTLEPFKLDGLDNVYMLTNLYTSKTHRNQGYAKQLLTHICAKADTDQFAVLLEPKSDEDIEQSALIKMYQDHGFEELQSTPLLLARFPKPLATSVTIKPIKLV
jgi:ribosomal protein S18 acetylase RimI-like enzyme